MNRVTDSLVCLWILLIVVTFWGPFLGLALPPNLVTALYAAFLLLSLVYLTLGLLRRKPE